jgi:radical SAM superfamily enzyme YgiQ (UPF0313 family)
MLKIYLADLANNFVEFDNKTIPIGVGYVGAYCKKRFGNRVDLHVFRTYKALRDKVQADPPDVLGLGTYDWNFNLSNKVAEQVKKAHPNCLTILGGANIQSDPSDNREFLKNNPSVDCLIYDDGEFPFASLIELLLKCTEEDHISFIKRTPIDGVRSLVDDQIVMGKPNDNVQDLDVIPSPYLMGLFDDLLKNPDLMPIIQNVRGCPYLCSFCVSGSQGHKIRSFSYERVISEIEYFKKNTENSVLRFSDDNFGVVEQDIQIAEYIRKSFDTENYPLALKAYSAKKLTERTRRLAVILKPLMLMCISFQTTTQEVLKLTKRYSAPIKDATFNLEFARQHGIATATELIFGLPGETLESMKEVINKTVSLNFDSMALGSLWLLRGAELNEPKSRETYEYRSQFMIGENALTVDGDFSSFEADEIVVASKFFSHEEWIRFIQYQFLIQLIVYFGYSKELLYFAIREGKMELTDILDELLDNKSKYPFTNQEVNDYSSKFTNNMFDSQSDLEEHLNSILENLSKNKEGLAALSKHRMVYNFVIKLLFDDQENQFLNEIQNAIQNLYKGDDLKLFREKSQVLLDLSISSIIDPRLGFQPFKSFRSKYDIPKWISEGYSRPLSNYDLIEMQEFSLSYRNEKVLNQAITKCKNQQNQKDAYTFFRYLNTPFLRRVISLAPAPANTDSTFFKPWDAKVRA